MDTPLVKRAYNLGLKAVPNFVSLSEAEISYYEGHLEELPDALRRGFILPVATPAPKSTEPPKTVVKFDVLANLGIIVVPAYYVHEPKFQGLDFSNPTRVLKPGDRLWVRAHKQIVGGTTTSEERLACLKTLGSHLVGAQGVRLVRGDKQAWKKVPKEYLYASFDEKDRLPIAGGRRRVPAVSTFWRDDNFLLGYFESVWLVHSAFFSFCDEPAAPAGDQTSGA